MAVRAGGRVVAMALTVLALAALAAACNSESDAEPGRTATVPTAAPTTTTTDPYALPEVIDEAYVNRVLEGLDAAFGDIVRLVKTAQTVALPTEAVDGLRAVYAEPAFVQHWIDNLQQDVLNGFPGYRAIPGNQHTVVAELIEAQPSCIFARVQRDYSDVGTHSLTAATQWIAVVPNQSGREMPLNTTGWQYLYDGFQPGNVAPANPCAS